MSHPSSPPTLAWCSDVDPTSLRGAIEARAGELTWTAVTDEDSMPEATVAVVDARRPDARRRLTAAAARMPVVWWGSDLPERACDAADPQDGPDALARRVRAALRLAASEQARTTLARGLEQGSVAGLVGASAPFRGVLRGVRTAAEAVLPVLVTGPRGSGKDAVARAIHALSGRPGPLRVLPCARLPAAAHAERLFGGALPLWDDAAGGTLILDEIDALAPDAQATLLARLDRARSDVRVIATTRVDLATVPTLRPELHYRLAVLRVVLPPLAQRGPDIEFLAAHGLARLGPDAQGRPWTLTAEAATVLRRAPWPGHVRELFEVLDEATARAGVGPLTAEHLPARLRAPAPAPTATLAELERETVLATLEAHDGNVTETGRALGIPRSTLYRRLKRWGVK